MMESPKTTDLTLLLAGDVMTGRGIDQVLPHSSEPRLHETYASSARQYVRIAERENGPIPDRVAFDYVWGDALKQIESIGPDVRIINLETAVTTSDDWWRGKRIHYRMHPGNAEVLTAASIDICVMANNHVADWGFDGLRETVRVLQQTGLKTAGAGNDRNSAKKPASLDHGSGRLLVFSYATPDAGVPLQWSAGPHRPGVNLLRRLDASTANKVTDEIRSYRKSGDRVVISIHWGGNWGYEIPDAQIKFAHHLIDTGAADLVHGHSSHHPKGIEVYNGRPILYGCGDLLNDYEGISGHEKYRGDLSLLYLPTLNPDGDLVSFEMVPMQIRRFQLVKAPEEGSRWLAETMDRECAALGASVHQGDGGTLALKWQE